MEMQWSGPQSDWVIERRRALIGPTDLNESTFLIAVSMRNPQFSNRWMQETIGCVKAWGGKAVLTLVDLPYLASIDVLSRNPKAKHRALLAYEQQRSEQVGRIQRIASDDPETCEFHSWDTLQALTPRLLQPEVVDAFFTRKSVHALVMKQVRRVFDDIADQSTLERLAMFFLQEVPILAFLYYTFYGHVVDLYPGPQADFFWELDGGLLQNELPSLSRLALQGAPHTYAAVSMRSA
jgi:hypothetical protein